MLNLDAIAQILNLSRAAGQTPTEIHFSKRTLDEVKAMVRLQMKNQPDTRSMLQRFRVAKPEPQNEQLILCGLPTFENPDCDDECVAIRTASAMDDPLWLLKLKEPADKPQHEAIAETPWFERGKVEEESDKITSTSLISASNKPSASDVLMASFENADKLSDVIVVRIHKSGDIDMSASMPKIAAAGYLQRILSKTMFE